MVKLFLIVLFFCGTQSLNAQKKVLIIGNSLMYYNSLNETLSCLLNSSNKNNDSFQVDIIAKSGYCLRDHLNRYYDESNSVDIDFIKLKEYVRKGISQERLQKTYRFKGDLDTINASSLEMHLAKNTYDFIIIQEHATMIESDIYAKYIASKSVQRFSGLLKRTGNEKASVYFFTEYPDRKSYKSKETDNRIFTKMVHYDTISCFPLENKDTLRLNSKSSLLYDSILYLSSPNKQLTRYDKNLRNILSDYENYQITQTGVVFHLLKQKYPRLKMHSLGGHPSKIASYSFALVFAHMLLDEEMFIHDFNIKGLGRRSEKLVYDFVSAYFLNNENNLFIRE